MSVSACAFAGYGDVMSSKCPYAAKCGGCDYQGIEYSKQLELKWEELHALLKQYCKPEKVIGMNNPNGYRCKVTASYTYLKNGSYISGVYEKGSHRIVKIDDCMITDKKAGEIILTIRNLLKSFKIKTYNEDTGFGLLRHVQVRVGRFTGQIMVILVVSNPTFPSKNNFVKALRKEHPEITTVVLNINDKHTGMVLGERNITIYGKGFIEDELCGMRFKISPGSFYQVNPVQTQILYNLAMEYADIGSDEVVLDAYSGTGTIGCIASKYAKRVIEVELNKQAVRDAIDNIKKNNISNVRVYADDATRFIAKMAQDKEKVDVIMMDPPRSGSTPEFIDSVARLSPSRVVYVSCGPESLARDLGLFKKKGYVARKIQPVDMFGYTKHVETVVLMTRTK